jgi:tRNA-splicing ligase RtcB
MIDTNKLLRDAGLTEPAMFRRAVELAAQGKNKKEILHTIREDYDFMVDPRVKWQGKSRHYETFGEVEPDDPEEEEVAVEWDIPRNAIKQMNKVMSIPPAEDGALMPDAHKGYGMPIGGVVGLDNAVSPSFVGYDIACRMTVSLLDLTPEELISKQTDMAYHMKQVSSFGLGSMFEVPREHPVMSNPLWEVLPNLKALKSKAHEQLGSSGGGNHFFDALIGEVLVEVPWLVGQDGAPLEVGDMFTAIMTHSGSRGTGYKTATHYLKLAVKETRQKYTGIEKGYEWLSMDSEAGKEYWAAMTLMGQYAQACHDRIHYHFAASSGIVPYQRYENHHNFAWKEDGLIIHRKGATPARVGEIGIIPGTSATHSFLVEGLGNPLSLNSSSHGAGRPFSRTEAKRQHDEEAYREQLDPSILMIGVAQDETFMAYKDINRVIAVQDGILVKVVAKMFPQIVIMGGNQRSDDGD